MGTLLFASRHYQGFYSMSSEVVYVALGSNLQDPVENIQNAILELDAQPKFSLLNKSRLYRSPPMGPQDQPHYVNAVVSGRTSMRPIELLDCLQSLERKFGRKPYGRRWGERELDLDILLFGNHVINIDRLQIPHVGLSDRAFVLQPLADINRRLEVPRLGTVERLLEALPVEQISALKRL